MKYIFIFSLLLGLSNCKKTKTVVSESPYQNSLVKDKMCGMSFTAPQTAFSTDPMVALEELGVGWIACLPYTLFYKNKPTLHVFGNGGGGWWGETNEGICSTINYAHAHNIKVMLKPQIWAWNQWVGDLDFQTEAEWDTFENSYTHFIMNWVALADSMNVEMVCIGTEIRHAAEKRPNYWRGLIDSIRKVYSGKLTYAPNWDDYDNILFWDKLDYIGVDAYFPLLNEKTPKVSDLKNAWKPTVEKLKDFSEKWKKPILFTEFGYLSLDGCAYNTWDLEKNRMAVAINEQAQANAIQALLETFGTQDWWAGGFQWKWFPNIGASAGEGDMARDYTPQNKKCEEVLKAMYK